MKLTSEQIRTIRKEYVHRSQSPVALNVIELAQRYKVSQNTIRRVAKGQLYRKVK
jgi:Mor family transcriptional regulator